MKKITYPLMVGTISPSTHLILPQNLSADVSIFLASPSFISANEVYLRQREGKVRMKNLSD